MIHSIAIIGELCLLLVGGITFPILIHIDDTHLSLTRHIHFLVHRAVGPVHINPLFLLLRNLII